jgi:hypothetical protein
VSDNEPHPDPWVERAEGLEDLQHALVMDDDSARRRAEERIAQSERRIGMMGVAERDPIAPRQEWRWTHPSVVKLAQLGDPIDVITGRARDLALSAMTDGWSGPPYDPIALASFLGIETVPKRLEDEEDARLVPLGEGTRIEFNPTRRPERRRFSVAHEIAHTLFEDYAEAVRRRTIHRGGGDDWQLESLCNLAAGELLMPAGSFVTLEKEQPTIKRVMQLRLEMGVSTEAVLLRFAHLTETQLLVFVASPIANGSELQYRIDYATPSRSWRSVASQLRNRVLPHGAVPERCASIGYTALSFDETWLSRARVECVGLPPYPGQSRPRVAGLAVSLDDDEAPAAPRLTEVIGDATNPPTAARPAAIAHVVNDRALTWHGRFATSLRKRWPRAQSEFATWATDGNLVLSAVHSTHLEEGLLLFDMVAQRGYGPSKKTRLRYDALRKCLAYVGEFCVREGMSLHIPRIGSGEAHGDWDIVRELISDELSSLGVSTTIYVPPNEAFVQRPGQASLFADR